MSKINFFKKKIQKIRYLFPKSSFKKNIDIKNIKSLDTAQKNDLTFYDSKKYKTQASKTKASFCLTTEKLASDIPQSTEKIIVKSVLYELAICLKKNVLKCRN